MTMGSPQIEQLLTPMEAANMFRVTPNTVARWARAGKLNAIRTLGGHRRFREADIRALLSRDVPEPRSSGE
jgi:excisionase family DNA binding protein